MKKLKIGNVKIKNQLFLAPMVEVTDLPYRLVCRKSGAGMAYTEMIYVDALTHENYKTKKLIETNEKDKPVGIQITGSDINEIKKAISMKIFDNYDLVDINCGCPSVRITGNQAGSYLLKEPNKIEKMIREVKAAGYTTTAKIRLGFENNRVMEIAKLIEKAGADALTIHARLAIHSGKIPADWKEIEKVKRNIGIPVIGNGDIKDGNSAEEMLNIADGAMIARAAIGDPLIFKRISYFLKRGKEKELDVNQNMKVFNEYIKLCEKYNFKDIGRIKYIGGNFIKNFDGAAKLRSELMKMSKFNDITNLAKNIRI